MANVLPINDGCGLAWAPDVQHVWDVLRGLLEGEGVSAVEELVEEDEEEERRPTVAGGMVPV